MNQKELEIFELCDKLANLLGDKEAIADLKALYEKHPEMFKDMKDVFNTITEITREPEVITNAKRQGALLALKQLDNKKMGEIAIENDKGTNVIFHANKKRAREFNKIKQLLVETPTPSTHRSESAGELTKEELLSGANALSTTANPIISKNPKHDSLNNKNSNQTPNQSDDKSNSQADDKKQALQYLRDNKPNIDSKESKHSSKDKSSKESSNQSSKLLDPNKQNKSENKPNTRKQRK